MEIKLSKQSALDTMYLYNVVQIPILEELYDKIKNKLTLPTVIDINGDLVLGVISDIIRNKAKNIKISKDNLIASRCISYQLDEQDITGYEDIEQSITSYLMDILYSPTGYINDIPMLKNVSIVNVEKDVTDLDNSTPKNMLISVLMNEYKSEIKSALLDKIKQTITDYKTNKEENK